jgi:cytochrome c-type biogenesis protein CcmH
MSIWLLFSAMTAVALALLAWPLLRRHAVAPARRDYDLTVYRAQLQELERERARGLLGEAEAEAARLEVQRRMLATEAERGGAAPARTHPRRARAAAALLLVAFPLLSGILYLQLGSPDVPGRPFASRAEERQLAGQGDLPSVEAMIARLEERVAASPDDFEGWLRLGNAYSMVERFDRAADAYRRAIGLQPEVAPLHAALAEVLALAAGGIVTEQAHAEIERALDIDPKEPRARFYQGIELAQRGEQQQALDVFVRLAQDSPVDAPWLPALREQASAIARDLGLDPDDVLPEPKGPAVASDEPAGQAPAMADLPPAEQKAAIREMVTGLAARLEQQPDDLEGWRMLARSYSVLGEPEKAAEAYEKVAGLTPDDLAAQQDYAEALLALQRAGQPLTPDLVEQMRRIEALDADNPFVLFFLGKAAQERGDVASARDYWQRLLAMMPEDAPERASVEDLLEQLDAVN